MTLQFTTTQQHASDELIIDCRKCVMRRTAACADCVVTFLLDQNDERRRTDDHAVVFDLAEQRAMRTLSYAGLLPELRYKAARPAKSAG